jgi:hypothetical protein
LIAAEQSNHPEFALPSNIVADIAKAFEMQLKQVVLPALAEYLAARNVLQFPRDPTALRDGPVIAGGRPTQRLNLGAIEITLRSTDAEFTEFCRLCGIDLIALRSATNDVIGYRNVAVHQATLPPHQVAELRDTWLGVDLGNGGIFRLVTSDQFNLPVHR